ncbi:MAG: T9SS type A sorting domain-containing protein, partial [Saprospiraceae bacterium]|nr:T9SS type A sorting domain-containing protein [Saprospiraceae bacterium]
ASNGLIRSFSLGPNPAQDAVWFSLSLAKPSEIRIEVLNLLGQVLETQQQSSGTTLNRTLDVSGYPEGNYLLRLTAGEESVSARIVIQRG